MMPWGLKLNWLPLDKLLVSFWNDDRGAKKFKLISYCRVKEADEWLV
jgi:hypothetical protein